MCNYPKTIFSCHHVQMADRPIRLCEAQRDYVRGTASEACDDIRSHPLSTVKQPFPCAYCKEKKAAYDEKIREARDLIAAAKHKLQESRGSAAVAIAAEEEPKKEAAAAAAAADPLEVITEAGEPEDEKAVEESLPLDPAEEFLRKKLMANDAHLMMWGN